ERVDGPARQVEKRLTTHGEGLAYCVALGFWALARTAWDSRRGGQQAVRVGLGRGDPSPLRYPGCGVGDRHERIGTSGSDRGCVQEQRNVGDPAVQIHVMAVVAALTQGFPMVCENNDERVRQVTRASQVAKQVSQLVIDQAGVVEVRAARVLAVV